MKTTATIKERLAKTLKNPYLPFAVLLGVLLVCHLLLDVQAGGGDDTKYRAALRYEGMYGMLYRHYFEWSARTLLEAFEALMSWLPAMVWRLVNPVMVTLCAWGIATLTGTRRNLRVAWALCGMMLLYQWPILASAGWRVTTVVYVWTTAALLGALWPMAKLMRGEKPGWLACVLCVPCTLFAVNMEQVLVIMLAALVLYLAYRLVNRQGVHPILLLQAALCVAMLLYTLASPGVQNRFEVEITSAYIDFNMLSFFDKLQIGVSSALVPLVYEREYLFDGLCILLAFVVWQNNKNMAARVLGIVPAAVSLAFSYGLSFLPGNTFRLTSNKGFIMLANHDSLVAYLPLLLLYLTFIVLLVDVYLAIGHRPLALACAGVLVCGLLSRVTMGFSPTAFTSGERTGFYFCMAVVAACCLLLAQLRRDKRWIWLGLYGYIGVFAVWRTVGFLLYAK